MGRRVVVTGLGTVNSLGNTVSDFWAGTKLGKSGIGLITKLKRRGDQDFGDPSGAVAGYVNAFTHG